MRQLVESKISEHDGEFYIIGASFKYPLAPVAQQFCYLGLKNGTNIAKNVFMCLKCNEYVENKERQGTNPFTRHIKNCSETFVELTTDDFSVMMCKCLGVFGINVSENDMRKRLMGIGRITDQNM